MGSSGNRENILRGAYTEIGAGVAVSEKGQFFTLQLLIENEGKHLESKYIYEQVWGMGMNDDPKAVRNTVTRLRGKIAGSGYIINTSYNKGYRLERERQI